ncbi:hypothetical protein Q5425_03035 [Amycolatopsis sp. A133]|uniref:hypothetical protein n=1 Tax=Amycolatopsis sp. A133 TaxID=3064472 RepID=UPI0027F0FDB7|nr:hypothetical protein [Amycolatopsis sp. A133]MDQ7802689.1 hypothetical protein [Amycolatopsis sp. A133]
MALVILGGTAFLLGVVGFLPRRVSWGKNLMVDLRAGTEVADAEALTTPQADIARVAQDAIAGVLEGTVDDVDITKAARLADHALFKDEIMTVVMEVAQTIGADVRVNGSDGGWWNARVARSGRVVYVAIRLALDDHVASIMRARVSTVVDDAAVLVVAREVGDHPWRSFGSPPPAVVKWRGDADDLRGPLSGLLSAPEERRK